MTTNVFDMNARQMATDSRWSIDNPKFIIYVDDTGFDKICVTNLYAFMFAGNGELIQAWKDWIASGPSGSSNSPAVQDGEKAIAICIVNMAAAEIKFEHGQDIVLPVARFTGTGSIHAHTCWLVNSDAKKAVDSAKKLDCFSGGDVAFVDFDSGQDNLKNSATIYDAQKQLLDRGMVMYKNNDRQVISIKDAAANDPDVKVVVGDVTSGKIVPSAPCDAMYNTWTEDSVTRLHSVLDEIFG